MPSFVLILEDDEFVRSALANLCRSVGFAVREYASTDEFLSAGRPLDPSCLILDVRFPGSAPSGLDLQRRLTASNVAIPIIFVTGHGDVPMSVQAMKSGAIEFLLKPVREEDLLCAIRRGLEIDRARSDDQTRLHALLNRYELLTIRERQIMSAVSAGLMNKQIAGKFGISEVTVKVHRGHVMQKMSARSLAELVRMNDRLGLEATAGISDTKV